MPTYSKIKSKPCTMEGCNRPRFSGGLCTRHQPRKPIVHKPRKAINRFSSKRVIENRDYDRVCQEADKRYSWDGEVYCFFCLLPTGPVKDHHHVAGRAGELLLKGIIPCHPECHRAELGGFHGLTLDKLIKKSYIERYLSLLEETSKTKYNVLLTKLIDKGYEGNHKEQRIAAGHRGDGQPTPL